MRCTYVIERILESQAIYDFGFTILDFRFTIGWVEKNQLSLRHGNKNEAKKPGHGEAIRLFVHSPRQSPKRSEEGFAIRYSLTISTCRRFGLGCFISRKARYWLGETSITFLKIREK